MKCKDCYCYHLSIINFNCLDCCNPYGNRLHKINPEDDADDCPFLQDALEEEEDRETTERVRKEVEYALE